MALQQSYPASVNSRQTELAGDITDTQTSFEVLDGSVLPDAPNLLTLGTDESAETVRYTGKSGNQITGVTRGFEGAAKSWVSGTKLARYFTAYDHDTFRQNVSDLNTRLDNIPAPQDASLTDKGIVQLSNEIDGDRESVAATEKAVNDARVTAISSAGQAADVKYIRKDRPSNLLPNSSGEMGLQGWTNVSSAPFQASPGDSLGPSTFATTTTPSILRSDSKFSQETKDYTLSADFLNPTGIASQIHVRCVRVSDGSVLAEIMCDAKTIWHRKSVTFTLPSSVQYYIEIVVPSTTNATRRVRRIMFAVGTDGDIWNQDANDSLLFQSVSDGKTAIAAAITDKGVAASGSDTFPQLATKIGQISTGPKYATGTVTANSSPSAFTTQQGGSINLPWVAVTGLGFRPNRIIIRVSGTTTNLGMTVYNYETRNAAPTEPAVGYNIATVITSDQGSGYNIRVYERVGSNSSLACVNNSQFFMPVSGNGSGGLNYTWEAFQV